MEGVFIMAKISTIKKEVTFSLELSEKEFGTIVSALHQSHYHVSKYAKEQGLPHLTVGEECDLFEQLKEALEGGAE